MMVAARRMWLEVPRECPDEPVLHVWGQAFRLDDYGETFEVAAAALKGFSLSDIPLRARVRICSRVIGSQEN